LVKYGLVDFVLATPNKRCRWTARVGFHASFNTILGQTGFLEHFNATFYGQARYLTLNPNKSLPVSKRSFN